MPIWFEKSQEIECDLERVKAAVADPGEYFVGVAIRDIQRNSEMSDNLHYVNSE